MITLRKMGIVKLHPTIENDWIAYILENYFQTYGCPPLKLSTEKNNKSKGNCVYSKNWNQVSIWKKHEYLKWKVSFLHQFVLVFFSQQNPDGNWLLLT